MVSGAVKVELVVEDGVCACPGGPALWSLTQGLLPDSLEHLRRAECLGCGRRWEKRRPAEQGDPTEDDWRAIPAVEVH